MGVWTGSDQAGKGSSAAPRLASRARHLSHPSLLYTLALLGGLWGGKQIASQFGNFWGGWWHGALLIYQPPLFAILPMYALFLLLTPLLLQEMAKGRARLVLAASLAIWLVAQWGIGSQAHNPPWLPLGSFNILAWQFLVVAGAYFGYRKAAGLRLPIPDSGVLFAFSVGVVVFRFFVRHQTLFFGDHLLVDTEAALGAWKSSIHPLRLINFAACAYVLWYLPRSVDARVEGLPVLRWLRYLGRHSLQVFGWSVFVAYVASSYRDSWTMLPPVWRAVLAVTAALSLVIPAWVHERWKRRAVPAAASFA
jgi:hypothetical protein